MARAALNLSIPQLAALVGVSKGTIERLEKGDRLKDSTFAKVQLALETAAARGAMGKDDDGQPIPPHDVVGVVFVAENGDGPGVRLRKPAKRKARK